MAGKESEIKLADMFDKLRDAESFLNKTEEVTVSPVVQAKVKEAQEYGERAIELVNMLHLFSSNEDIEEIATNEIRFLLLPAYLGFFTMKSIQEERLDVINKAKLHYRDFLKLCKDYGLTNYTIIATEEEEETSENAASLRSHKKSTADLERERSNKIARYKEQKATESRLEELYPIVQQEHVDDETKREYYLTLVKKWVNFSIEELESIESEVPILQHMAKMKKGEKDLDPKPAQSKPKPPMRPFIITKDKLQKEVFGLGYPSVPTYTIDEFYERQVELGNVPTAGPTQGEPSREDLEREEAEKEERVEKDDEETLRKAREWDEYRDEHRRGWGNTYNKG